MADGFRVLENGDYRITEADVFRITEHFSDAFGDLTASGSLSADPTLIEALWIGESSLTADGTLEAQGLRTTRGASDLSATGSSVYASAVGKFAYADLSATGSITALSSKQLFGFVSMSTQGTHLFAGYDKFIGHSHNIIGTGLVATVERVVGYRSSNLTADSSLSILGHVTRFGLSALTATGTLVNQGLKLKPGVVDINSEGTIVGTPKYTGRPTSALNATGTLAADGTRIAFSSTLYVKDTSWKVTTPYVKHLGSWKIPDYIYVKVSGAWTRVY
jgi:hypothetical protein